MTGAIPTNTGVAVFYREPMTLIQRLTTTALAAASLSVLLACLHNSVCTDATIGELRDVPAETMARIRVEEANDIMRDALRFARVLAPAAVAFAWWRRKTKEATA